MQHGAEISLQAAGVVALALKIHRHHGLHPAEGIESVGQLDLAAVAGGEAFEDFKDARGKHIPAENGEIG